ncbi:ABC transporter permease [Phytoactinopolyspora limicola]|uniref:ABC transporter permease n=1 Tax=Phytoactinopolyspora limicola TaxID=2715536 RepID=UPI00140AA578|nr:ABC transporter permease [Phytoactinopolyspora limicola]
MGKLLLTRLASLVPLLFLVAVFVFFLITLMPVDPVRQIAGEGASPEQLEALRTELGYDRALPVQLLSWLGNAVQGDLGTSLFTQRGVVESVLERLPVTAQLVGGAMLIALLIGLPAGVYSALRAGSLADRAMTALASLGLAMPGFWLALLLVLMFAVWLGWFPVIGYTPFGDDPVQWARGLVLPCLALGVSSAAVIARQTRSAMRDVLQSNYVQALRATGTPRRRIVYGYALRNAMVPVLTVIGWELTVLLAVSFVIERVFGIAGTGTLLIDAVVRNDIPMVQGGVVLIACIVVVINLSVDVGYGLLNPKVRPQ